VYSRFERGDAHRHLPLLRDWGGDLLSRKIVGGEIVEWLSSVENMMSSMASKPELKYFRKDETNEKFEVAHKTHSFMRVKDIEHRQLVTPCRVHAPTNFTYSPYSHHIYFRLIS
jgi:hypothetical protein